MADTTENSVISSDEIDICKVLSLPGLVVLDFTASFCGACKLLEPKLEQMAKQHKNVKFIKVDISTNQGLAYNYAVTKLPTLVALNKGLIVGRVEGADESALRQMVIANL